MLNDMEEMMCFAAIVDEGNITKAAQKLSRSKAHISRMLSQLETSLGGKLFHRSTRSLTLTDLGVQIKADALSLYHNHHALLQNAKLMSQKLEGDFTISVTDSLASYFIEPIMAEMLESFPNINFNIIVTNKPLNMIRQKIDLSLRVGNILDDQLVAVQLFEFHEKLYAATDFDETTAPLHEQRFLANPYSTKDGQIEIKSSTEMLNIKPTQINQINRYNVIQNILSKTDQIGILPEFITKDLVARNEIKQVYKAFSATIWPIYMLYPSLNPKPIKLQKISDFLKQKAKEI